MSNPGMQLSDDSSTDTGPAEASEDREPFEEIAERFQERYRRGRHPSIAEWAARYPELADDIRTLFPTLIAMERLGSGDDAVARTRMPETLSEYEILREIGSGGMGVVYEARHRILDRHVAIKVLPRELAIRPDTLERFQREARAAATLQHPHIVPVYDVGCDQQLHFYVMQYLAGDSLDHWIRSDGAASSESAPSDPVSPRPPTDGSSSGEQQQWFRFVAELGRDVADGLHFAHAHGVLHRDIKPSNLMLDQHGKVWIVDFGLALTEDVPVTQAHALVGTLRFMPPERLRGWSDPRSDVYSLGLTLYEVLTGHVAYRSSDQAALLRAISDSEPPRPRSVQPAIPVDLETVLLKAIEKEPAQRYPSAAALAADLQHFLDGDPVHARRTTLPGRLVRWCRRKPQVAALLLVLTVVMIVATAGSVAAAWQFRRQANSLAQQTTLLELQATQLQAAHAVSQRQLLDSLMSDAQVRRGSRRIGQRFQTLAAASSARALLSVPPAAEDLLRLRNEAIAALALGDLRQIHRITLDGVPGSWQMSPDFDRIAYDLIDPQGGWRIVVDSTAEPARLWESPRSPTSRITPRFSPDGELLALTYPAHNLTELRDAHTGDVLFGCLSVGNDPVAFNAAGKLAAIPQSDGVVLLYDLSRLPPADPPCRIETTLQGPVTVRILPQDGTLMVWGKADDSVVFCDRDGRNVRRLELPVPRPVDLAMSPDGRLLSVGSADFSGSIWSRQDRQRLWQLSGHHAEVVATGFSADGHVVATGSWDQTTRLWNPETGRLLLSVVGQVQFDSREPRLALRQRDQLSIFAIADGREFQVLHAHGGGKGPWALAVNPAGTLLASAGRDGVRIWDALSRRQLGLLSAEPGQIVDFTADGRGLMTGGGRSLQIWTTPLVGIADSAASFRRPDTVPEVSGRTAVDVSRFHADRAITGRTVWMQDYGRVEVAGPGDFRARISCPETSLYTAISPDGQWVAITDEAHPASVAVYDAERRSLRFKLPHPGGRMRARFSPDSRRLVTSTPGEYFVWEVEAGTLLATMPRDSGLHGAIGWSGDGSLLALACGGIHLFDGETLERLAELTPPVAHGIATDLCLTPDGSRLFVACESNEIHCWDLQAIRSQLRQLRLDWD